MSIRATKLVYAIGARSQSNLNVLEQRYVNIATTSSKEATERQSDDVLIYKQFHGEVSFNY
jgi:hypothetical protein